MGKGVYMYELATGHGCASLVNIPCDSLSPMCSNLVAENASFHTLEAAFPVKVSIRGLYVLNQF